MRIVYVVGTRPTFMKVAPVIRALAEATSIDQVLVHTGQHYDPTLSDDFFDDLQLPAPDVNLQVGSGTHAAQSGRAMMALEPVFERIEPDWVYIAGSANSALAAALVASKLRVPIANIEAGLRSHDRSMPEEINRLIIDRLSGALFTTEPAANENLRIEGIDETNVHFVGNVMIDTLDKYRPIARRLDVTETLGLAEGDYVLVTLHRPRNVDSPARLSTILDALGEIATYRPVVFPMHPRTASNIKKYGLEGGLAHTYAMGPTRYTEFLAFLDNAGVVVTDSGGVAEEATVLGVPCITLRDRIERPITISEGTNRLFADDPAGLAASVLDAFREGRRPHRPELWDGHAAERIARVTIDRLSKPPNTRLGEHTKMSHA